jgi:molybdopterin-containing oxidoreductase family iron-sulfur binding subunit
MPPLPQPPAPGIAPNFWRSLDERAMTPEFQARLGREFPAFAAHGPSELDRRQFVKLMGASIALAGMTGCVRRSAGKIVPYVVPPESTVPGDPQYYATAMPVEGFARGIVVESHLGRPTKIEGNSSHPESLGATDAITQAAILSLYDSERSSVPLRQSRASGWAAFGLEWAKQRAALLEKGGEGLVLLTEPTSSPSIRREIQRVLEQLPKARWYQHTPLGAYEIDGLQCDHDFAAAEIVLTIGSDCLYRHPAALRYGRAFAGRRRVEGGKTRMNRHYALESTPSVTGGLADLRLPASPARMRAVLDAVGQAIGSDPSARAHGLSASEAQFVGALVDDLRRHGPAVLCVAGPEEDADIRRWALALNAHLGSTGRTLRVMPSLRSDTDRAASGDLKGLGEAMQRGEVSCLFILGSNPAYTAPADIDLAGQLPAVPFTVHHGGQVDETAQLCTWHLPESHWLETWADLRAFEGTPTILQPLIEPLFDTRSGLEVLRMISTARADQGYDIVRETWKRDLSDTEFDLRWNRWLNAGIIDGEAAQPAAATAPAGAFPVLARSPAEDPPTLIVRPDPTVLDGRFAGNAWLQELPKPLTHLVWDNAALVSPDLASRLGVTGGDMLALSVGQHSVEAAAWIMPGQARDCVTLSLGYGRTAAGAVGTGRGFNAYRLRSADALWQRPDLQVRKTGGRYSLVTTQDQFAMEGRDLVRVVSPDALLIAAAAKSPSLYAPWKSTGYAWGMAIDLSTCLGCNACIVACQAENNIPVVGKEQVARGRQMHWIRLDCYFEGDPDNPRVLSQPVPCMQCETAPCELVCPVGATVHSSEGLNEMVYNRCVGTRYCSNNCPYKVRRFNFFDYRAPRDALTNLQRNPDVTIRERGVMEKCTYCVQRINAARITAENENRPIHDGEIRTACQQACPAEAIVFGNLADPDSRVRARKLEPTNYVLLEELNTRPRTTYLAKVRNAPGGPMS